MLSIEELSGQAGVEQADQQVADGLKTALVVIPQDFSQKIEEYQQTKVSIIGDPTQKTLTDILAGLMNYAITSVSLEGNLRHGIRSLFGQSEVLKQASTEQLAGLEAQTLGAIMTQLQKMFFEPLIVIEAEQQVEEQAPMTINFFTLLMPGFTVMFAFFLVGAIGQSIFNEKDSGTIRRLLVAPIHKGTLIGGKVLAFACQKHGGFYLGSIGGPAALHAQESIRKVELLEYPELGMEAIYKIEVVDFPAFILVDDKGNDFFMKVSLPVQAG